MRIISYLLLVALYLILAMLANILSPTKTANDSIVTNSELIDNYYSHENKTLLEYLRNY